MQQRVKVSVNAARPAAEVRAFQQCPILGSRRLIIKKCRRPDKQPPASEIAFVECGRFVQDLPLPPRFERRAVGWYNLESHRDSPQLAVAQDFQNRVCFAVEFGRQSHRFETRNS